MDGVNLTRIVLAVDLLLLVAYDIWAYWSLGQRATISLVLHDDACRYPILGVVLGVIVGHLFFPLFYARR